MLTTAEKVAALEPLAGAALAISLAYLALDRFRYRDIIRSKAAEELTEERCKNNGVHHTTPFKTLVWLAGPMAPEACKSEDARRRPAGFEPGWYAAFFNRPFDEGITAFFAVVSFLVLEAVVCINAGISAWYVDFVTFFPPALLLSLVNVGALLPVAFVLTGRRCVSWATNQAGEMADELQKTAERMKNEVHKLEPPITLATADS